VITLQQGIPGDAAKEIVKHLKDLKLKKVQASIQGDQVRISSASKDDLQGAMQALRAKDFGRGAPVWQLPLGRRQAPHDTSSRWRVRFPSAAWRAAPKRER
jgi:hypothetical protein